MGGRHSLQLHCDLPHSESGLTRRELKALTTCWAAIERDLRNQSIKLFVRFLRAHPDYRRYFRSLSVVGPPIASRVATDARVQTHFRTILTSVGSLVTTAATKPHNLPLKYDFLALVHRHLGLTLQDFFNFRDELIGYLRSEFPAEMTPVCAKAWYKLLTGVFNEVCERIEEFHRLESLMERPSQSTNESGAPEDSASQKDDKVSNHERDQSSAHNTQVLFWDHRKNFWKTQQELWGEQVDEEEDDEDYDGGGGGQRRTRRWWRRASSKVLESRK